MDGESISTFNEKVESQKTELKDIIQSLKEVNIELHTLFQSINKLL
jgi:hypothetical protein